MSFSIIILGSGRSGTSLLTGLFANSELYLGGNPDYLGKSKANPKGYFEDYEVNTLNEDILSSNLIEIPEWIRKKFFPSRTFYRARWLARFPKGMSLKITEEHRIRISKLTERRPFCYKDPRFSYTLKTWKPFLPKNTKFLVVYRQPGKTADSIVRECKENKALHRLQMNYNIALKVWFSMYDSILRIYREDREKENWFFIHYEQLFDEKTITEIKELTDSHINGDFADKKYSRSIDKGESPSMRITKVYEKLNTLSKFE